jgi:hypothetical protein
MYIYIYSYLICAFCSFLNLRWKESHRLVMRMMSTWHRISSIFNHQKIHSIYLSFSRTSFLSIFYQKMITCNLVILQFFLLFPKKNNVPNNKLSRSPPEVPGNQSFMLCNDHGGQNMGVDNNVINDSIQQPTQFRPSFPQTMVSAHAYSN